MPVMLRFISIAGFFFAASALTASQHEKLKNPQVRREPDSKIMMRADGHMQRDKGASLLQSSSETSMESWTAAHPPLPYPYFWYAGRIASSEGASLLQEHRPTIEPPSTKALRLQAPSKKSFSQWHQDQVLMPIFERIGTNGFFVESGARDGETDSNSLLFEIQKGWTGLLVEPDPKSFPGIRSRHRHVYAYNGCLAPSGHEETLRFYDDGRGTSHITKEGSVTVPCVSLQSLLHEIGQKTVDFWSLDIEGSESGVLHTTDFSKVEVGLLLIEMNKNGPNNDGIKEVMDREGFVNIGHTNYIDDNGHPGWLDHIFVNPKYFEKRGLAVPTAADLKEENRNQ